MPTLFASFRAGESGPDVKTAVSGVKDMDGTTLSGRLIGATPADMSDESFAAALAAGGRLARQLSAKSASGGTKKKSLPELAGPVAVAALAELLGIPAPTPTPADAPDPVPTPVRNRGRAPSPNGTH